ncbi:MAG: hypothetical protein V4574_02460, partial [Pseudomonadota bacterium]
DMKGQSVQPGAWPLELLWRAYADDPENHLIMPHVGGRRAILDWYHHPERDPRTRLKVTGEVDGSPGDVDPLTGSGPILAADRARAVATLLIRAGAVAPGRITISTGKGQRRAVLTLGYDGGRQ